MASINPLHPPFYLQAPAQVTPQTLADLIAQINMDLMDVYQIMGGVSARKSPLQAVAMSPSQVAARVAVRI